MTGRLREGVERVGCSAAHSTTKVKWTFGNAVLIHLRYVSYVVHSLECDRATDHGKNERQNRNGISRGDGVHAVFALQFLEKSARLLLTPSIIRLLAGHLPSARAVAII